MGDRIGNRVIRDSDKKKLLIIRMAMEDLFRYLDFDENHRKTIRNTNLIERVIRETIRRTKVMDTLDNEYGVYGILMGVIREQNKRWTYKSHWKKS